MSAETGHAWRLGAVWFARLWAVAALAHVAGNPRLGQVFDDPTALGLSSLALGLLAIGLLLRPTAQRLLGAVAVAVVAVAVAEAPFLSNHWLLAAIVSVALLVSLFRADWWAWFSPTGRWLLIGFYSWAAFNKLTEGFFDTSVSCGTHFTNQWLAGVGLGPIPPGGWVAFTVVVATAAVELAVPVLLLTPATRRAGVLLAMVFHFGISLDLGQHFYDFTALLFPLFGLFLPDEVAAKLEERRPRLGRLGAGAVGLLLVVVVSSVMAPTPGTVWLLRRGVFFLWVPFGLWLIWRTARVTGWKLPVSLRLPSWVAGLLVALVVFNGFTPYLELKTGYGWNMYAGLVTANGESNHLVIRRAFPMTSENQDPVVVRRTDDPGLAQYIDSGYAIPWSRFLDYLAEHPAATVTYERSGRVTTATGADIGRPLPWWRDKFQLFRAIDLERPVRCQAEWMPAR